MVGFDGSIASQHAVAYAAGLSHRIPGTLYVAYIARHPPSISLAPYGAEAITAHPDDDNSPLQGLVAEILQHTSTRWEFISCRGGVAVSLERLAQEYHADVLVVGRSRTPRRHVLASVPARLARHARCPITVVP